MEEHEVPRQVEAILELTEAGLDEQYGEHSQRGCEEERCARSPSGQIAEQKEERTAENGNDRGVGIEDRLEAGQPVNLCRSSAGMWAGRSRKRAADQQSEPR